MRGSNACVDNSIDEILMKSYTTCGSVRSAYSSVTIFKMSCICNGQKHMFSQCTCLSITQSGIPLLTVP
jgi:hypothetical protein